MTKFRDQMHQLRLDKIDTFCRHTPKASRAISNELCMNSTYVQKYLRFMEEEGHLICNREGGIGNNYLSTGTFRMKPPEPKIKQRRPQKDYDLPNRHAPNVKPFSDEKALPREFFGSVVKIQPLSSDIGI